MKKLLAILLFNSFVFAANPEPSGPLKVFTGPEGETIAMVEINGSKEMLVHFKGIGTELEGKSKVYKFEDKGRQGKEVYWEAKVRKSKPPVRHFILLYEGDSWTFYNPFKASQRLRLHFSQDKTDKFKLEDVLKAYQP